MVYCRLAAAAGLIALLAMSTVMCAEPLKKDLEELSGILCPLQKILKSCSIFGILFFPKHISSKPYHCLESNYACLHANEDAQFCHDNDIAGLRFHPKELEFCVVRASWYVLGARTLMLHGQIFCSLCMPSAIYSDNCS